MELIESYGLTLADINNLIRHAISAADNVHPYNMANSIMQFNEIDETQSRRSNSGNQKERPRSRQSENGENI
jgi:replication initiation and membrane attachment protein DnaB